jgi:DNA-binding winged helix-turn-helix (wHTH) protein/TolB-like protein/Flp pilus assembly protein TadD
LQGISKEFANAGNSLEVNDLYEFCRFRFDPENHLLESEGNRISLTPKGFEILLVLVKNGNRLTTKEELMRKVWPHSFVEEANLTVNMSALRKQLGETPDGRQYIETVPTKGYRFALPVTELLVHEPASDHPAVVMEREAVRDAPTPSEELPVEKAASPVQTRQPRVWNRSSVLWVGLIVILLAGLGYVVYRNRSVPRQVTRLPRRLAVLPYQNLRQNAEIDFLGFSLADAVITKLGYVKEIAVRPSYAVQKYRSQPIDIEKVAADLNVDTLLTGTFLREGDDLRIACQLIDVKTQNLLWKGVFDFKYDKLLTVQDQVAQQTIRGLELTLSTSEAELLKTEETVAPPAYEYYLRGVDLYAKGDFPLAIKMLEKSTELAPRFASAWASLGRSYNANASFQFGGAEHYGRAEAAFSKALSLQPTLIDARVYMANMLTDTGRVEEAVPLLREALKTNPNHAEIHWELGYAYRFGGMLMESVSECEQARRLDPGVKLNSSALNAYLYLGQYDRFLESLPKTDESSLIVFYRGLGEYHKQNAQQAEVNFDHAFELDRALLQARIGKAISFGMKHQHSSAIAALRSLESKIKERGNVDPEATYKVAEAYATMGENTSALRMMRQSIENGFFPYPYFATDPLLKPLRSESEFTQLLNAANERHESFKRRFF